ncbi:hypothetical protein DSL72_000038 [Monilinia vaccinii-corymbosi]|uniref:Cyanovirin-N domain-containing protein n=1 Tax=Monilinia vaccinii-corymbosi TaxID=61207 RepID=A0A8A3P3H4_9HELO|nr:hypothetical protein DSL72_000038 [Monilinia vaccinii-corymbosi]
MTKFSFFLLFVSLLASMINAQKSWGAGFLNNNQCNIASLFYNDGQKSPDFDKLFIECPPNTGKILNIHLNPCIGVNDGQMKWNTQKPFFRRKCYGCRVDQYALSCSCVANNGTIIHGSRLGLNMGISLVNGKLVCHN